MRLGFYRAIFFYVSYDRESMCATFSRILRNVLETYTKYFDVWKNFEVDLKLTGRPQYTPNHSQRIFENLDFRADFRIFHGARFLPRHFFLYVSNDHESICATFPRIWAMS